MIFQIKQDFGLARLLFTGWVIGCIGVNVSVSWAQPASRLVRVDVNPTVETIAALMNQISPEFLPDSAADPNGFNRSRAMQVNYDAFRPFFGHPAVAATKALAKKLGTGVYLLGLYARPLPATGWQSGVSPLLLEAVHPNPDSARAELDAYMAEVARFYRDARVAAFMTKHRDVYKQAIAQVSQNRPPATFIPTMEAYYGAKKGAYTIMIMPFFITEWGMGWQVGEGGQARLFNICSPYKNPRVQGGQVLDAGFNDAESVRSLCVHEFGHSFVNPHTMQPAMAERINQYKDLFKPVPGQSQYTDMLTLFNELTVRAGEIRIALKMGLPAESQRLREDNKNWPYLDHFTNQLARYESNRKTYPTFTAFLPTLIDSLKTLRSTP